ncbi:winged helix-turn-helix transcriptional regulator, partial [candidate division TA06 bacterium]|nr:winged helix-turn-helix transcriptional regulator [candidate division TA06 bacterium]
MTAIDRKDLLILRKLEWRGRIDPSEIGRAVGLPKEAVKKRIERLEGEGVIKGVSLSLFPPPVLGGEWMWLETSIVTKG